MKLSQEKLAEAIQENMKDCQAEDLFSQVLYLANLSGALSLTARRLIDTLPQPEKPGRGKKSARSSQVSRRHIKRTPEESSSGAFCMDGENYSASRRRVW